MPKSKPFTIRLSEEVGVWLERENRRTKPSAGADHTALVREERASDGGTHPWDEEYREWRKERDEYLRAEHRDWLESRVIE
jgi:hypothetical protein